jgi:hypothetical protein
VQAVKGYVENGRFYPTGKVIRTPGRIRAVLTIFNEPVKIPKSSGNFGMGNDKDLETIRQKRLAFKGSMEGQVWMADDFDEPLEEMKEYME